MANLGVSVANDMANAALNYIVRGDTLSQTTEDKPLLRFLKEKKKSFGGGLGAITDPVQGAYMSDTAGFFAGYTADQSLTFTQAQNILRTSYNWKECACNLWITWTELKEDGITITDNQKTTEHSEVSLTRLTAVLKNRMEDFMESYSRAMNSMLWNDGSQDALQVPGVRSILTDVAAVGTTGGLNRATYWWWRHRTLIGDNGITPSPTDQNLSRILRTELRQLRRYGGKPDKALCGSNFLNALEQEIQQKGVYTQEGFTSNKSTDLGMKKVRMMGLGEFEYDPTLDDLGYSSRCYVFDSRRMILRPMEDEEDKVLTPERPYNYLVFLKTMTWTGALVATQLTPFGIYEVKTA